MLQVKIVKAEEVPELTATLDGELAEGYFLLVEHNGVVVTGLQQNYRLGLDNIKSMIETAYAKGLEDKTCL